MKAPRAAVLTVAALVARAGAADAQRADEAEEALVREGVALRRAGRDDDAVGVLRRAWAIRQSPRASGQLALAEQALGRWTRAETLLRAALAAPDDPWVARNRAVLEGALAVALRHLGTLEVRGCDGAALSVDGEPVATPDGIRLAAGTARVTCARREGESITRVAEVAAGAAVRVTFPPSSPRGGGARPSPRRVHPLVWIGAATAGAAAVAVGALFAAGEADADAYDRACPDAPSPDRAGCAVWRVDAQSRLDTYSDAMVVGWAVLGAGVVAAGVGVGLTLASPRGGETTVQLQASPRGVGLRVTF